MLDKMRRRLHIGIHSHGVTVLETTGLLRRRTTLLAESAEENGGRLASEQLASILNTLLKAAYCKGATAHVVLGDDLARLMLVSPPGNAKRHAILQAAAAMRFQTLYGEPPTAWTLEAQWSARHSFLACAVPRALIASLLRMATEHQLTVVSMAPQFVAGWDRVSSRLQSDAWFGAVGGDLLTLGARSQGRLVFVRTSILSPNSVCDVDWFEQHVRREALRMSLPVPATVLLVGHVPSSWHDPAETRVPRVMVAAMPSIFISAGAQLAATGLVR